jgi:hypothetical protein
MEAVRAVPIPDRKALDKYGNPTRWILKIIEPRELRGLIAFPRDFEVKPATEYVVDIVRREKNYAIVRMHQHRWEEYSRYEDAYVVKIFLRCRCGAFNIQHIEKFNMPLVAGWKNRWYIQHAVELRRRAEEMLKNAPPIRYYYVAVRNAEAVEELFAVMKRKTLKEVEQIICKQHEVTIYDDEERKWRTLETWRGSRDKSWLCTEHPPYGYVAILGWVDADAASAYAKAKAESERLWDTAEEILGQKIDIGQCIPGPTCQRYASRLASFL